MADKDPLVSAWFGVEFQGQLVGAFRECTGLGSENEVVEYKASDKGKYVIKKVAGNLKWNNITLKRGITDAMDMWKWRGLVEQGQMSEARKNGTITYHLNNAGEQSPREAIRSWKRHVYPLTWGAEMSMDGEGYVPKLPRKRQIPRRKPRGTCRVVGW